MFSTNVLYHIHSTCWHSARKQKLSLTLSDETNLFWYTCTAMEHLFRPMTYTICFKWQILPLKHQNAIRISCWYYVLVCCVPSSTHLAMLRHHVFHWIIDKTRCGLNRWPTSRLFVGHFYFWFASLQKLKSCQRVYLFNLISLLVVIILPFRTHSIF